MSPIVPFAMPKECVAHKVYMYFIFTIAMAWIQIGINIFISAFFNPPPPKLILYTSEICFMTIVLTANNLRDLLDGHTLKKGKLLLDILVTFNVLNGGFPLVFSVALNSMILSNSEYQVTQIQFGFVIITYIAAVVMGLAVQISAGIDACKVSLKIRR